MRRSEAVLTALGVAVVVGGGLAVAAMQPPLRVPVDFGAAAAPCRSAVAGDADGDGWADAVVTVGGRSGGLQLLLGSPTGLVAGERLLEGTATTREFGGVATGDIGGDGCADAVAVSTSGELTVLAGAAAHGLATGSPQRITLSALHLGPLGAAGGKTTFGAPVLGDFNGDGHDDLAMVETTTTGGSRRAGVVIVPGSAHGLEPQHAVRLSAPTVPTLSTGHGGAFAGGSVRLIAAPVRGGGTDDLGVLVRSGGSSTKAKVRHGDPASHAVVDVVYGGPRGLGSSLPTQVWDRESHGVPGRDAAGDDATDATFGDFDGDGNADLAISSAAKNVVVVLHGGSKGLTAAGAQVFTAGKDGVPAARSGADFGESVTVGDFDGDGRDELAVLGESGRLWVLHGSARGLTAARAQRLTLPDGFGRDLGADARLEAGSFGRGASSDLLVCAPGADDRTGAVLELFSGAGLSTARAVVFREGTHGVPGTAHAGDEFGG